MYRIEYHCFDPRSQPTTKFHSFRYFAPHLDKWKKAVSEEQYEVAVLRLIHRAALVLCKGKIDGYQVFHMGIPYRESYPWVFFGAVEEGKDAGYINRLYTRNGDRIPDPATAFVCDPVTGDVKFYPGAKRHPQHDPIYVALQR